MIRPFAEEWNLEPKDIEAAAQLFAQDYGTISNPSNLLLFLYAKGILSKKSSVIRKRTFELLLAGQTDELNSALNRLKTIVEKGESSPNIEAVSAFDDFIAKHKEWNEENSFVVFRDHPDLKGKSHALVERLQESGLCYMNAGVVLQHYLVAMNNTDPIPMLNMAEYVKKYLPTNRIYELIWNNEGSDSLGFLKDISVTDLDPDMFVSIVNEGLCDPDLATPLKSYGPALLAGFCVTKDFISKEWQHLGRYRGKKFEGRHAMVLVGYRIVDGKKRYLLQNWWKDKPYVEVDSDYLLSSDAHIYFIKEKQFEMGSYPTNNETLVECELGIDACEVFFPDT